MGANASTKGVHQLTPFFKGDVGLDTGEVVVDFVRYNRNFFAFYTSMGKTYELAGNKEYTVDELAKLVLRTTRSRRSTAYIPGFIMRALSCPHEFLLRRVPFPLPTPVGLTRSYIDAPVSYTHLTLPTILLV